MKRPNPFPSHLMSPSERRAELCSLLALGLIRLKMRDSNETSDSNGEFPLHNSADQSAHANPFNGENHDGA